MTSTNSNEDNYIMPVIDYINRHYIIDRIRAESIHERGFPLAGDYRILDIETQQKIYPWEFDLIINQIFSVNPITIRAAIKKIIHTKINLMLGKQTQFDL